MEYLNGDMETWRAEIKEVGHDYILTPIYCFGSSYDYIKDEKIRESEIRKYLIDFWGLNKPDVEWYKLERTKL